MFGPCGYDPYLAYCDHPKFPRGPFDEWNDRLGNRRDPAGLRGCFNRGGARIRFRDIKDGLSNVLMVGEFSPQEHWDTYPRQSPPDELEQQWHWIASPGPYTQCHTLAPINYRTENTEPCVAGPEAGTASAVAAFIAGGNPVRQHTDENVLRTSSMNWNLSQGFKSRHPGGANFLFVDGSVHFLGEDMDHWIYQFLGHRKDGLNIEGW